MKTYIMLLALLASGTPALAQQASETPPPPCLLALSSPATLYSDARPDAPGEQIAPDQPLQIVGQSGAFYAVASPGASAGAAGTLPLSWLPLDTPDVALEGGCDGLPVFYPLLYAGDVCTALTGMAASSFAAPDAAAEAESLPGVRVEVLARTQDGWLGYDPASADDVRGSARLRWISADDADQTDGACEAVPALDSVSPVALGPEDSGSALSLRLGESVVIRLPSNPSTGYRWQADAANNPALAQQQGEPVFAPGPNAGMAGAGGEEVITLVAVEAGAGEFRFVYARPWETDVTPQPDDVFTLALTVGP